MRGYFALLLLNDDNTRCAAERGYFALLLLNDDNTLRGNKRVLHATT
jgi:hypothetical protein